MFARRIRQRSRKRIVDAHEPDFYEMPDLRSI
jgi:hypothetical protein